MIYVTPFIPTDVTLGTQNGNNGKVPMIQTYAYYACFMPFDSFSTIYVRGPLPRFLSMTKYKIRQ